MTADWRLAVMGGALLALAGCQSSGGGGGAAANAGRGGSAGGDKTSVCTAEAMKKFSVTADNISLSNEYPHNDGDAIDGAATLAVDFQRFRCEFNRAGALTGIVDIKADS